MKVIENYLDGKEIKDKFKILELIMLKESLYTIPALMFSAVGAIVAGAAIFRILQLLAKAVYKKHVLKKLRSDTCKNIEPKFRAQCKAHIKAQGGKEALRIISSLRYKCNQSKNPEKCFNTVDKAIDDWKRRIDPETYYQKKYS